MNQVDLDKYYRDCFSLCRTIVLKINSFALRDNEVIAGAGYTVSSDKTTWRYYMNLNGDYHFTDEPMYITSIDNGDTILFDKDNLALHLSTKREYAKGGDAFNRLVNAYPSQTNLIRGVINPIPYAESIEAPDHKILRYNTDLVLWNETQLIGEVEEFINVEVRKTRNSDYEVTEDLYMPLMEIKLRADILKAIHTVRLEYSRTRHAHDFFIWSHIDSYGKFSPYKNSLTREQVMWMFREIAWLRNNPGQRYTFGRIVENILTKGKIPIAEFDMVSNTETQLEDITSTPTYRKYNLNLVSDYGRAVSFIDTERMIAKEQPMAKDNREMADIYFEEAMIGGTYSLHSELPTKVLESSMADFTNKHVDTLMSVVYNEWVYLAGNKKFNGRVVINDPKTGKQVRIGVADAHNLWRYLVERSKGYDPVYICPSWFQNVSKINPPTIEEIVRIAGKAFVRPYEAHDILAIWEPVATFVAPDYLMQYAFDVYANMWKHKKLYSQFGETHKRARMKYATKLLYESGVVKLGTFNTYNELLNEYEFDFDDYEVSELRDFAWDIFKRVTGWDTNAQPSMRVKQSELIEIMTQLISYTVHTVTEIRDGIDSTELVNQSTLGDVRHRGKETILEADFKGVQLTVDSFIESKHSLDASFGKVDNYHLSFKGDSSGRFKGCSNSQLKSSTRHPGSFRDSVGFFNSRSYLRFSVKETPLPDLFVIPPTYYGRVPIPERNYLYIPPTHYGTVPVARRDYLLLDPTYYGRVDIPYDQTYLFIPPTYYGTILINGVRYLVGP